MSSWSSAPAARPARCERTPAGAPRLLAHGWGTALSLFALARDEFTYRSYAGLRDGMVLFACALGEAVGYRQLTTVWPLRGLWSALRGRAEWGVMTPSGFSGGSADGG